MSAALLLNMPVFACLDGPDPNLGFYEMIFGATFTTPVEATDDLYNDIVAGFTACTETGTGCYYEFHNCYDVGSTDNFCLNPVVDIAGPALAAWDVNLVSLDSAVKVTVGLAAAAMMAFF